MQATTRWSRSRIANPLQILPRSARVPRAAAGVVLSPKRAFAGEPVSMDVMDLDEVCPLRPVARQMAPPRKTQLEQWKHAAMHAGLRGSSLCSALHLVIMRT